MLSSLERRIDEIQRLLTYLIDEAANGIPILVEGLNDKLCLEEIGVKGKFLFAKTSGKSILDVLKEVETCNKEVILLLDFDKRGREMTYRLIENLQSYHIKANIIFWKNISSIVGREVKDIEGLSTYIQTLKRKLEKHKAKY